jgi:hypothetical protein
MWLYCLLSFWAGAILGMVIMALVSINRGEVSDESRANEHAEKETP